MEQTAQYDQIGSKYDEYARTATLKRAESYTFFRMVGELAGQRVLALACGFGFYTRQLKQRGAAQVVGVDTSPEEDCLAQLQRWQAEIQPDYLIIRFRQPGGPTHQKTLEAIRVFGEQVIPKL
jgi:ubiquinone/menaquinone biosynthesis C-methylase UbiE